MYFISIDFLFDANITNVFLFPAISLFYTNITNVFHFISTWSWWRWHLPYTVVDVVFLIVFVRVMRNYTWWSSQCQKWKADDLTKMENPDEEVRDHRLWLPIWWCCGWINGKLSRSVAGPMEIMSTDLVLWKILTPDDETNVPMKMQMWCRWRRAFEMNCCTYQNGEMQVWRWWRQVISGDEMWTQIQSLIENLLVKNICKTITLCGVEDFHLYRCIQNRVSLNIQIK